MGGREGKYSSFFLLKRWKIFKLSMLNQSYACSKIFKGKPMVTGYCSGKPIDEVTWEDALLIQCQFLSRFTNLKNKTMVFFLFIHPMWGLIMHKFTRECTNLMI